MIMVLGIAKVLVAVSLSLLFTVSLIQLVLCFWIRLDIYEDATDGPVAVNKWLEENHLEQYQELFIARGK